MEELYRSDLPDNASSGTHSSDAESHSVDLVSLREERLMNTCMGCGKTACGCEDTREISKLREENDRCKKCGGEMKPGKAIRQTLVMGVPDFPGNTIDSIGQTLSYGGPGRLVDCMKCSACGWSVTEKQT